MKKILAAGVAALVIAGSAHAQGICGSRETIVKHLAEQYSEMRIGMGFAGSNAIVEIFVSDIEKATWTIIVTRSNGLTCLLASGVGWEQLNEELGPVGDPT